MRSEERSVNTLIVMDSHRYVRRETSIKNQITQVADASFRYTDYENRLTELFHGMKVLGSVCAHICCWGLSLLSAIRLHLKQPQRGRIIIISPLVGIFYCFISAVFKLDNEAWVAGFVFSEKRNTVYLSLRERFVNYSYKNARGIVVYSRNEVDLYAKRFPELLPKFKFLRYGRDYDIFNEFEYWCGEKYIASGGVSNRDYATLACALDRLDKRNVTVKCKIATRPGAWLPHARANVEILHDIRINKFGSFLDKSLFVVIPVKDSGVSGGHMVLLEAMSRGKLVIVTDIPVVRDYVDEESVIFYKAGDSNDLASKIEYVLSNLNEPGLLRKAENARALYLRDYTFSSLLDRLARMALS